MLNFIKKILNNTKKIDTKSLPSQGLFYKNDFKISIRKADIYDIIEYEQRYKKDNVLLKINELKKIVEKNTILSKNYEFNNIKSIDIVFLFLEIVKFTKNKEIFIPYFNDELGIIENIKFQKENFNYFILNDDLKKNYNPIDKYFLINGYRFSLPSIGIENSLTNFLISKQNNDDALKYNDYNYDFTFFIDNKSTISFDEIENLIEIFNYELDSSEISKISKIVKKFNPIQKYSLRKGNKLIEVNSKIDLEKIWK